MSSAGPLTHDLTILNSWVPLRHRKVSAMATRSVVQLHYLQQLRLAETKLVEPTYEADRLNGICLLRGRRVSRAYHFEKTMAVVKHMPLTCHIADTPLQQTQMPRSTLLSAAWLHSIALNYTQKITILQRMARRMCSGRGGAHT